MAYTIKGEYVVTCNCNLICPCGVDGIPTSKDGQCHGGQVLHITEGTKDGVDLAGVDIGWVYHIPGNVTGGDWTMVLVLDPSVSDDQVKAVEDIIQGKDGGPFAEFAPLIGTFKPTERAAVYFHRRQRSEGVDRLGIAGLLAPARCRRESDDRQECDVGIRARVRDRQGIRLC